MFSTNILLYSNWDIIRQENKVNYFIKLVTTGYTQEGT